MEKELTKKEVKVILKEADKVSRLLGFKTHLELHDLCIKNDIRFALDTDKLSIEKRCNLNEFAKLLNLKDGIKLINILNQYFVSRKSVQLGKSTFMLSKEFNVFFSINDRKHIKPVDASYYIEESIDLIYSKITLYFRNK